MRLRKDASVLKFVLIALAGFPLVYLSLSFWDAINLGFRDSPDFAERTFLYVFLVGTLYAVFLALVFFYEPKARWIPHDERHQFHQQFEKSVERVIRDICLIGWSIFFFVSGMLILGRYTPIIFYVVNVMYWVVTILLFRKDFLVCFDAFVLGSHEMFQTSPTKGLKPPPSPSVVQSEPQIYRDIHLQTHEVEVVEELERAVGRQIPLVDQINGHALGLTVRNDRISGLTLCEVGLTAVPPSLCSLSGLECLILDQNKLTSLPECLATLPTLTRLSLNENCLTAVPLALTQMPRLEELRLARNQLQRLGIRLKPLNHLRVLDLSGNQLRRVPVEFARVKTLRLLDLRYNPFPEGGDVTWGTISPPEAIEHMRIRLNGDVLA